MHIVIGGNIGAGKSTVISTLRDSGVSFKFIEERVGVWNRDGILQRFYEDMATWAVPLQDRIITDFDDVYSSMTPGPGYVYERSVWDSLIVFKCEASSEAQDSKWTSIAERWLPDLYILIDTPVETCYSRMKGRGREAEKTVAIDYLKKLERRQQELCNILQKKGVTVIRVPGGKEVSEVAHSVRTIISEAEGSEN